MVMFDSIEWDENNLDHACRRLTAAEIEQVTETPPATDRTASTPTVSCSPTTPTAASA
ncbi:MAG: hypothetical protein M3P96_05150 [Actinomycetota bacterium]|nr:hypothetical protein [Actinomycetota bacterium]